MKKANCYECKHRGTVPGSCHSRCNHPAFGKVNDDPLLQLAGIFASVKRIPPVKAEVEGIKVVGNPQGISGGWFNHPFNFDPVWLESCTGFEKKTKVKK